MDDLLLHRRADLGSDLDAQVAAGDHDAVGGLENVVELVDGSSALDLGQNGHVLELADLAHALRVADEGGGDEVDALLEAEEDVLAVTVGHGGQRQLCVGNVHALALAERAAVLHGAANVLAVDVRNGKADEAVVDEDGAAHVDLARELQVVEVEVLGGAEAVLGGLSGGNDNLGARRKLDLGVPLEKTGADLGSLGVEQDAHGHTELLGDALDALHALVVLLVAAVAEVEARDVHARLDHLAQRIVVIARRSHGADDLGSLNQHSKLRFST